VDTGHERNYRNDVSVEPKLSRKGKRLWGKAQKRLIVSEAMRPGMSVSQVSRRYDVNANLIFRWINSTETKAEKKQQLIAVRRVGPSSGVPLRPEQFLSLSPTVPKLIEIELPDGVKIKMNGHVAKRAEAGAGAWYDEWLCPGDQSFLSCAPITKVNCSGCNKGRTKHKSKIQFLKSRGALVPLSSMG